MAKIPSRFRRGWPHEFFRGANGKGSRGRSLFCISQDHNGLGRDPGRGGSVTGLPDREWRRTCFSSLPSAMLRQRPSRPREKPTAMRQWEQARVSEDADSAGRPSRANRDAAMGRAYSRGGAGRGEGDRFPTGNVPQLAPRARFVAKCHAHDAPGSIKNRPALAGAATTIGGWRIGTTSDASPEETLGYPAN